MRSPTKYNSSAQKAPTSASWASLPILGQVFNRITDPKDLVACACVCKSWSAEIASSDHLFQQAWTRQVSDQGLWRWARASGGYREQLRADHVVRKGEILIENMIIFIILFYQNSATNFNRLLYFFVLKNFICLFNLFINFHII